MNKNLLILATALFAFGCTDKGGDTGDSGAIGTDTDTDTDTDGTDGGDATSASCAWDGTGLAVDIVNGDASGYNLGLAETNGDAEAWTAEDCYLGYVLGDGTKLSYCHPAAADGVYLESVSSPDNVVEGSTTLHTGALENTYFLEEVSTGFCWIWGDDITYYAGLGCEEPALACTGD